MKQGLRRFISVFSNQNEHASKLKMVYDNDAEPGFEKGWGFSALSSSIGERYCVAPGLKR